MFVDGEGRLSSAPSEELEYLKKTGIDDYLFAAVRAAAAGGATERREALLLISTRLAAEAEAASEPAKDGGLRRRGVRAVKESPAAEAAAPEEVEEPSSGGGGGVAGALRLVCERTGWLAFFLCGLLLCERVMHSFGALLEREIELAFFVPLIIGHGGNSGGQAVSTVIRSIGRRSPSASEAISTVATEALAGALQSLLLGCLVGPALHFFLDTSRAVSTVMATTLPLLGLFSNCTGAMLPFLVTWAGLDPAVIVGPLMTTLVDTLGLMIYLSVATATLVHGS